MTTLAQRVAARFQAACNCALEENPEKQEDQLQQVAVAPPEWEGTVKEMKKDPDIDNPWALAWWMKNKGYESHKASDPRVFRAAQEELKKEAANPHGYLSNFFWHGAKSPTEMGPHIQQEIEDSANQAIESIKKLVAACKKPNQPLGPPLGIATELEGHLYSMAWYMGVAYPNREAAQR